MLIYAAQDRFRTRLSSRVAGISVPIDDTHALNTVMKLVRQTTKTTGRYRLSALISRPGETVIPTEAVLRMAIAIISPRLP